MSLYARVNYIKLLQYNISKRLLRMNYEVLIVILLHIL